MKKLENIEKNATIRGLEEEWHTSWDGIYKELFTAEQNTDIKTLYNVIKKSPELMACIEAIVEDVVGDYWKYWGPKSNIKKALAFEKKVKLYHLMTNVIIDLLATGNSYILKLGVDKDKLKDVMTTLSQSMFKKFNIKFEKEFVYQLIDQDLDRPEDLQLLKSSSVKINFDETGKINGFIQQVEGQSEKRFYKKDDIIHLKLMSIGGQPYGFTPIETLLSDIANLIFAKEFAGKYFENDGMPAWMINMPESNPDDRNYESLVKELREFKNNTNKLRTLVTTGKVNAEQINKFNKDMEFSGLIQHFTNIVLMAMGVPPQRVNFSNFQGVRHQSPGTQRTFDGYYKKISFLQKSIEEEMNYSLWSNFRVEMKFNRAYKIDEMREAQIVQILTQVGAITLEEARDMMGMEPELPKGTMANVTGDDNGIDFENDKKEEEGRGQSTEPPKDNTDNKVKFSKSLLSDIFEVDYSNFVTIVESIVGAGNFDNANILYNEDEVKFILYFSDSKWRYKTTIQKNEIDVEEFRVEKLRNAVKVFI